MRSTDVYCTSNEFTIDMYHDGARPALLATVVPGYIAFSLYCRIFLCRSELNLTITRSMIYRLILWTPQWRRSFGEMYGAVRGIRPGNSLIMPPVFRTPLGKLKFDLPFRDLTSSNFTPVPVRIGFLSIMCDATPARTARDRHLVCLAMDRNAATN